MEDSFDQVLAFFFQLVVNHNTSVLEYIQKPSANPDTKAIAGVQQPTPKYSGFAKNDYGHPKVR